MKKSVKALCLLMFVTLFTFSISCLSVKAYTSSDSMNVGWSASTTYRGGTQNQSGRMFTTFTGNERGIFYKITDDELVEIFGAESEQYSNCYVFFTNPYSVGPQTETTTNVGDLYFQGAKINEYNYSLVSWINNKLGTDYIGGFLSCGVSNMREGYPMESSFNLDGSVEYVNSIEDIRKYLIDKDDSVVLNGDPNSPPINEDNALPVPQQVSLTTGDTYGVSNESNLIYRYGGIFLKWQNPNMASFDAYENIRIDIKYKPKIKARSQTLRINKGIFTANNYYNVNFSAFDSSENMVNNYYSYGLPNTNALDLGWGYGLDLSGGYRYVDNDFSRAYNDFKNEHNLGNFICDMVKGTTCSIRYIADLNGNTYSSYWVDVGYGGSVSAPSTVSFSNASGDPVAFDDVDYTPSDQNISPDGDDVTNSSLLDRLRNALFNIGQLPDDLQNLADEGSDFAKFLAKVWKQFPEIYIIFIGGLLIAIILRILGR